MSGRIKRKWRPSLGLVMGVTLAITLALPLGGIVAVRYLWPMMGEFGYQKAVIVVSLVIVAAVVALGWALVRVLLRPIKALALRAEAIKAGEEGALDPLLHYGTTDMQRMGQNILDMGRVLQGREAVLRSYADHVTHEFKSPLTVLRGAIELLDSDLPDVERKRLLSRIGQATERMGALLDAQRALARAQEPVAAGKCRILPMLDQLTKEFPELDIRMFDEAEVPLPQATVLLVAQHLLGNSRMAGAKHVLITAKDGTLRFADDGPGVSEGNRPRIFDPFFTTRREAGGTGMGLPIVKRMLQAHGAEIALIAGEGAVFEISYD